MSNDENPFDGNFDSPETAAPIPDGSDPLEGIIEEPEAVTKSRLPLLKIGGSIGIVGLLAAGGFAFGPKLVGLVRTAQVQKPTQPGGNPAVTAEGTSVVTPPVVPDVVATKLEKDLTSPLNADEVKDLASKMESGDAAVRTKVRERVMAAEVGSAPEDIDNLKMLKAAAKKSADTELEVILNIRMELRGIQEVDDTATDNSSAERPPCPHRGSDASEVYVASLPLHYALLFSIIGAEPDAGKVDGKGVAWNRYQAAKRALMEKDIDGALANLRDAEKASRELKPPFIELEKLLTQLRRDTVDESLRIIRNVTTKQETRLEAAFADRSRIIAAVKGLASSSALKVAADDQVEPPMELSQADWDNIRALAKLMDAEWERKSDKDLLEDYYFLSTVNVILTEADAIAKAEALKVINTNVDEMKRSVEDLGKLKVQADDLDATIRKTLVAMLKSHKPQDDAFKEVLQIIDPAATEMDYEEKLDSLERNVLWSRYEAIRGRLLQKSFETWLGDPKSEAAISNLLKNGIKNELMPKGLLADLRSSSNSEVMLEEANRQVVRLLADSLADRLKLLEIPDDGLKNGLADTIAANRNKEIVKKLTGAAIIAEFMKLRQGEADVNAWEISKLVKAGIVAEKSPQGLLADLDKLSRLKKAIPADVVGVEEVVTLIGEHAPSSGSGGGGSGVSLVAVNARIKKLEEALKCQICLAEERIEVKYKSNVNELVAAQAKKLEAELRSQVTGAEERLLTNTKAVVNEAFESHAKTTGELIKSDVARSEQRLNSKLKAASEEIAAVRSNLAQSQAELRELIKQPRPFSAGQLTELDTRTQTLVENELARRGVLPVILPKCTFPKGPASAQNQRRALYQFGKGSEYFHAHSKDQFPAATRCFAEATSLEPFDPVYRYFLACSLYSEGRPVEALQQIQCAAELEKRKDASNEVSQRLERIQFGTRQWLERCRQSVLLGS